MYDIIIFIFIALTGGTITVAEVRLRNITADRAVEAHNLTIADAHLTVLSRRADWLRDHLTPDDVLFFTDRGWQPAPSLAALTAAPTPAPAPKPPAPSQSADERVRERWQPTIIRTADGRQIYVLEEDM